MILPYSLVSKVILQISGFSRLYETLVCLCILLMAKIFVIFPIYCNYLTDLQFRYQCITFYFQVWSSMVWCFVIRSAICTLIAINLESDDRAVS